MARADDLFIKTCKTILEDGYKDTSAKVRPKWADDGSSAYTKKVFGVVNRYDLSQEFPALTLRPVPFKNCVDELLWIWQRRSNNVHDLHSHIWDAWADSDGSIGKAYGYQLAQKYEFPEGLMNQVDKVRYDLRHNPQSRRIMTNIYNFADLHAMNLYPCAYSMTFNVVDHKLCGILNQRSNDILVANNWNVVQYAVLLHMLAIDAGLEVGELVHVIADAHIYDRHIPLVEELIKRPTFKAPKLEIDPAVKNFDDFSVDSFKLSDYEHNPQIKGIPVAV